MCQEMKLLLNEEWQLTWEALSWDKEYASLILAKQTDWLLTQLPCDVHMPLIEHGIIPEPLVADNCFQSEWTEDKSFWFKKIIMITSDQLATEHMELTLESLDAEADIWLNGKHLGHHHSAFYPFTSNVKKIVKAGENVLLIRVTSGLEHYGKQDMANTYESAVPMRNEIIGVRGDERRTMVRKPQYVYGWDWGPRVATCGIMKQAWIEFCDGMRIRNVRAVTEAVSVSAGARAGTGAGVRGAGAIAGVGGGASASAGVGGAGAIAGSGTGMGRGSSAGVSGGLIASAVAGESVGVGVGVSQAKLRFDVEVESFHPFTTGEATVKIDVLYEGKSVVSTEIEAYLRSGLNFISWQTEIAEAQLWWPHGMGGQPLYTVRVTATSKKIQVVYPDFKIGLRTVRINTDKIANNDETTNPNEPFSDERQFTIEVNGVAVFCKGGNWIPADSIYARVTDERYDVLIHEAKQANFNMLRIWGGGIYERDVFYDKCNEYGILVWQDFMFSCAKYPDDLPWFREEVEREIDFQTRRLRNHCSIALWCGNNENTWGFDEWWNQTAHPEFYGGAVIYNEIAPRIVQRNCPDIPYWNSSPYGGEHPNGSEQGDRHHWHDCTMNPDMEKRITPEEYDKITAKFISEYGYIGPCRKSTIENYHNGEQLDQGSKVWQLHNNTFEKETVQAGINKHYIDPKSLTLDEYLLYAGLCQGLMLGYSLEAIRSKPFCSGSLFWMYNDCWGEVGWTIIDYDLRRKISYYFVKRAFEPIKLILRKQNNTVEVTAINETDEWISEVLECGIASYSGNDPGLGNSGSESAMDSSGLDGTGSESGVDNSGLGSSGMGGKRRGLDGKHPVEVTLPPRSRSIIHRFSLENQNPEQMFCYVKPLSAGSLILPAVLRESEFRNLQITKPQLSITGFERVGDTVHFTVTSDRFAHGVHFDLADDQRLSDEYFDLLPGESRTVVVWDAMLEYSSTETIHPQSVYNIIE